jgi:hypothetical protein
MVNYKELYFAFLPIALPISSIFGVINGIHYSINQKNPNESFTYMVGYTSLGMITGLAYPITFPILAGSVLLKKK